MDTLKDLRETIQSDMSISSNSSLYPPATIDSAINRAYRRIGGFVRWPALEDAKTTTTETDQDYYDAPETWKPNSMFRLEIDGELYGQDPDGSPMDYNDFLTWRLNYPNSTDKKWAVQWLRYFIHPVPTNVTSTISVWGIKNVDELTDDDDITIFTYNLPDVNDAVVLEAKEILENKGEGYEEGKLFSQKATQIVLVTYQKIKAEKAKYEKKQPGWNVPDYFGSNFGGNSEDNIGNFN